MSSLSIALIAAGATVTLWLIIAAAMYRRAPKFLSLRAQFCVEWLLAAVSASSSAARRALFRQPA